MQLHFQVKKAQNSIFLTLHSVFESLECEREWQYAERILEKILKPHQRDFSRLVVYASEFQTYFSWYPRLKEIESTTYAMRPIQSDLNQS